jgi:hypothetical protein
MRERISMPAAASVQERFPAETRSVGNHPRRLRRRGRWLRGTIVPVVLAIAGCDEPDSGPDDREEVVETARSEIQGVDGALTVNAANTVLNQYAVLATDAAAGASSISVTNVADLTSPAHGALAAGDVVLILQAQGATIDQTDSAAYGTVSNLGNAGRYELVSVTGVQGNTIQLSTACGGLAHSYSAAGGAQVVRVPQYTTLTVANGASVVAPAWNGQTGGVVALVAQTSINLNGPVDVSARGFRGGAVDNDTDPSGAPFVTGFRSAASTFGAEKGESIAGFQAAYSNGRYGRGAPANGGGGGNGHNAGGGGGANGGALMGYTGAGVMQTTVVGGAAWNLDPEGVANGPGGGRGGYSFSFANLNALANGPGVAGWNGDARQQVGGRGGRPLPSDVAGRVFFGGGGGAGDGNNGGATAGARGGGVALLIAPTVGGSSSVLANGGAALASSTGASSADAPGGGGGGGTILVRAATLSGVSLSAQGGLGGNQDTQNGNEAEGPGGGGGGGVIFTSAAVTLNVGGALGGTTSSAALTEFPSNGATAGGAGQSTVGTFNLPGCFDLATPDTSIVTAEPNPTNDPTGDFTFSATEPGSTFECSVDGGAFAPCGSSFSTPALSDGSHTIAVRAIDPNGNVDPTPATYAWVVDTTAPDTTIPTAEPNPTNDPTGDFVFASNEPAATFECSVDGAAFVVCPASFSTVALADGSHTIAVRAIDPAGNVDPTPATYGWVVDTTPPDTTIATAEPNPTNDATGDFTFTSNDPTATFQCSIDGGAFVPCPASFSTVSLADGPHTIAVVAVDAAGNVDPTPASYAWVVDATAPETFFVVTEPTPTADSTADFELGSDDPAATFQCSVDGAAFVPCATVFSTAPLANGPHTIAVRAVDTLGNVDPTPATYDFIVEIDSDGDGLPDSTETGIATDPNDADSDDDGVLDGAEPDFDEDTDGDGLINALDPDSDDDGLLDGTELGLDCSNPATDPASGTCVADSDPTTTTNPLDADTDDGGVSDGAEDLDGDGAVDAGETDPTAGNGADDVDVDTDGDGLPDDYEEELGTDPNDADSDDDGVLDGAEPNPTLDTDGDGLINPLDPDSDDDALFDGTELGLDCSNPATDAASGVCVADGDAGATTTSPIDADSDDGGVRDGFEDTNGNGVVDAGETNPTDGNGADDVLNDDTDGDGLPDDKEDELGTDPNDADTDDDGVLDGAEPNPSSDTDGDGAINPLDPDSDGDQLFDGTELSVTAPNADTDVAAGFFVPDADPSTGTSAVDADSDDGGVVDGLEDSNQNGAVDGDERDPTAGNGDDDFLGDSDEDGLTDGEEIELGTDPFDADSDDDGALDGQEPDPDGDADDDGIINALDPDSDGDGLLDGTELGLDCSSPDTDAAVCVEDADGGATTTDPLDPDTDDGSVSDGDEDSNGNGAIDEGETDPNDPSDDVPAGPCDGDEDCPDGQQCIEGECVPTSECVDDEDCPDGEICVEGECVPPPSEECTDDADCADGELCVEGECVPEAGVEYFAEGSGLFKCGSSARSSTSCGWSVALALAALGLVRRRTPRR